MTNNSRHHTETKNEHYKLNYVILVLLSSPLLTAILVG
jgi:hypothetical protein